MGFLSPTTTELADSAANKLCTGEALTVSAAVRKAVVGRGITARADLARRTREVLQEMKRRSDVAKKAKKSAAQTADKIAERVSR